MSEFYGEMTIGTRKVTWRKLAGRLLVEFGGNQFLHLEGEDVTPERVRDALTAYDCGYADGKNTGRQILQNDFRNLMGLQ